MFCINLKEFAPLLLSGKQLLTGQSRVFHPDQEKRKSCWSLVYTVLIEAWNWLLLSRYLHSWKIRQFCPSHPLHTCTHTHINTQKSLPSKYKVPFFPIEKLVCLLPVRRTKGGQVGVHRLYTMFSACYGNTPAVFDTATPFPCTNRMYSLC